jgi:hypothetical protein
MSDHYVVLPLVHDVSAVLSARLDTSPIPPDRTCCACVLDCRPGCMAATGLSARVQRALDVCAWSLAVKYCVLPGECWDIGGHYIRHEDKSNWQESREKEALIAACRFKAVGLPEMLYTTPVWLGTLQRCT